VLRASIVPIPDYGFRMICGMMNAIAYPFASVATTSRSTGTGPVLVDGNVGV
jgi:hypothetical protein